MSLIPTHFQAEKSHNAQRSRAKFGKAKIFLDFRSILNEKFVVIHPNLGILFFHWCISFYAVLVGSIVLFRWIAKYNLSILLHFWLHVLQNCVLKHLFVQHLWDFFAITCMHHHNYHSTKFDWSCMCAWSTVTYELYYQTITGINFFQKFQCAFIHIIYTNVYQFRNILQRIIAVLILTYISSDPLNYVYCISLIFIHLFSLSCSVRIQFPYNGYWIHLFNSISFNKKQSTTCSPIRPVIQFVRLIWR